MRYKAYELRDGPPWRRTLGRKIAWLLGFKLLALLILWSLFFSPAQRVPVTPSISAQHLAAEPDRVAR
ncbi:MAG TPA: hypothetical protein VEZ88_04885 [Steroidobacteraceae bacterium]|nr:hypothetical protein [Steroidobacteraceae bacterium]